MSAMATKQLPEWATVGATVYAREQGYNYEAKLRKGTISRITATSIFVRTNLAAGDAAGEDRYTLQRWSDAPRLHGSNNEYYSRTLRSEEEGLAELADIKRRKESQQIVLAARRGAEVASNRLNPTTAREAIQALQTYLDHSKEA